MPARTKTVTSPKAAQVNTRIVKKRLQRPRPMDAAEVASLAEACESATATECLYECNHITELGVHSLCAFAAKRGEYSDVRRDVLSILVHCMRSPRFPETLGDRANTLLCDALGCEVQACPTRDKLNFYEGLGTCNALEVMAGLTVPAKFKLLKQLGESRWAEVLLGLIRFFFPEVAGTLKGSQIYEARALGAAAMRAVAEFVKLPAFPTCEGEVDPDDRSLKCVRATAVSELLRANVVGIMHRMVQHAHCAILAKNVGIGDAEWQAPLVLRGLFSLASSTNVQGDVTRELMAAIEEKESLFTWLIALLDVSASRVTRSMVFLCISMLAEEMTCEKLHKEVLASKLPSLLVRELGTREVPQALKKVVAYAHSAASCLYFLMYKHGEEGTRRCADQGALMAVLNRLLFLIEGAEQEREERNDNHAMDPEWSPSLKNNFMHTILFSVVFLKNAAVVDKKYCDEALDADMLKLFSRLKALFAGTQEVDQKIRTTLEETTSVFRVIGRGKVEQKMLEYRMEANVRKQQERALKSAALKQVRRDAGVEVALRDRPEEHLCPISYEVMVDPVVAADGHIYERVQIERWLEDKKTSPLTNANLSTNVLYPAHALKTIIDNWEEGEHNHMMMLGKGKRQRDDCITMPPPPCESPPPSQEIC